MKTLLHSPDEMFGHVVENTPDGVIYRDDGSLVDFENPRACLGCKAKCTNGEHDPCIANLPGTHQACCGHGLALSPLTSQPNGYVALDDGRTIDFSGTVGAERIRAAVAAALAGEALPEGFTFDETRMWWDGLSEPQVAYVWDNMHRGLVELVREALGGADPAEATVRQEQMWWEGLDEKQKEHVENNVRRMLAKLVREALRQYPPQK